MGVSWDFCVHTILIAAVISCQRITAQDSLDLTDGAYPAGEFLDTAIDKRLSRFVRIGRALSSFVRIGKNDPNQELYVDDDMLDDGFLQPDSEPVEKRQSAFVRIGRGYENVNEDFPQKRLSSFVRIGRAEDPDINDDGLGDFPLASKRGSAFIRMGKFPTSAYLRQRNGIIRTLADPDRYYRRNGRIGHSSFIRIGKRDTTDALRKIEHELNKQEEARRYIRFGKGLSGDDGDINLSGLEEETGENKDKRMSSFVRIGKSGYSDPSTNGPFQLGSDKRGASRFVRIGKSPYLTNDKRMSSFVRIGRDPFLQTDKRYNAFVRIGKSPAKDNSLIPYMPDKRKSSFVRIGKSSASPDDQYNDKVTDKAVDDTLETYEENQSGDLADKSESLNGEKIANKRMRSSFVRIGRGLSGQGEESAMGAGLSQTNKRALSSFVRIGKRSANLDATAMDNTASQMSPDANEA